MVRQAFRDKGRSLGAQAVFAVLNVGATCDFVQEARPDFQVLEFRHDPEPLDASHAGIWNMQPDMELIAELIAETVQETHPARG